MMASAFWSMTSFSALTMSYTLRILAVVVTTPEPTPTPEPEEDFRGILLPNSALYDGTAAQQITDYLANLQIIGK